jgi:ribosomal protein L11 methyltransferase
MVFRELNINQSKLMQDDRDLLLAFLLETGFESFLDENNTLKAYIPAGSFEEKHSEMIRAFFHIRGMAAEFFFNDICPVNWNKEWEKNFKPVIIDGRCVIKASFHDIPAHEYNLIINPEMAFGTGHHETTKMMVHHILTLPMEGMVILDMGCGTGVLGILAKLREAADVVAIDNDPLAVKNATENFKLNKISPPWEVILGDASSLKENSFDIILANINRNVILSDIHIYHKALRNAGKLVLSGILKEDELSIKVACINEGFIFNSLDIENQWISLTFTLSSN